MVEAGVRTGHAFSGSDVVVIAHVALCFFVVLVHGPLGMRDKHVRRHQKADDDQDHDNVEQENLQVLCIVRLGHVLDNLAVLTLEASAALARSVEADAAVHALA